MSSQKKKTGIVGGAGYTAGELLRILLNHPEVEIGFVQSESHGGEPLWKAHQDLYGVTDILFTPDCPVDSVDVLFLCSGHGKSRSFVEGISSWEGTIIDLSQDFRLKEDGNPFVYGLPEVFKKEIASSKRIANPGCFATALQLSLIPVAQILPSEVHSTGITGSTGAGVKPSETTHFSWRSSNLSVYKPFTHQHLGEVRQTLSYLGFKGDLNFIPVRGDFTRGIMMSSYFDCSLSEEELIETYKEFYKDAMFVDVVPFNPDLKMVVGSNRAVVYPRIYGKKAHVVCMIDNLVKGASGQAVQNMNISQGFPEGEGLALRALRF